MILATALYYGWEVEMVDVVSAFLSGEFSTEEEVIVAWPLGLLELGLHRVRDPS